MNIPFARMSLYLPVVLGTVALLLLGWQFDLFAESTPPRGPTQRLESGELSLVGAFLTIGLSAVALVNRMLMLRQGRGWALAEREANSDALTGLSNRRSFLAHVERALGRATVSSAQCAVLLIDLDRFKPINDIHGHAAGDAVLIEVARRLSASFPNGVDFARLGGDEFAVVLAPQGSSMAEAVDGSVRFLRELERPIRVKESDLHVGASIGIALGPQMGADAISLLAAADAQMYEQKRVSPRSRVIALR